MRFDINRLVLEESQQRKTVDKNPNKIRKVETTTFIVVNDCSLTLEASFDFDKILFGSKIINIISAKITTESMI